MHVQLNNKVRARNFTPCIKKTVLNAALTLSCISWLLITTITWSKSHRTWHRKYQDWYEVVVYHMSVLLLPDKAT